MAKAPTTIWYCPTCGKTDHDGADEALASPEHVPHRGVDIGTCKGCMYKYVRDFVEG
jgi:ribosomal protein L37AE/L43A